jgi:hypothetical protein
MDALALLRHAKEAGLRVEPIGNKLVVRGPKHAEPMVKLLAEHKAEVLAVLLPATTDARRWHERFTTKSFEWLVGDRSWEAAKRLAWGNPENEWHERHGHRYPTWQCAGCKRPIGGFEAFNLPDCNRVHLEPIDCLIAFGQGWRCEARAALIALGLEPPGAEDRGP